MFNKYNLFFFCLFCLIIYSAVLTNFFAWAHHCIYENEGKVTSVGGAHHTIVSAPPTEVISCVDV